MSIASIIARAANIGGIVSGIADVADIWTGRQPSMPAPFRTGGTLPPLPGGGMNQFVSPRTVGPAQACPTGYHLAKDGSGRLVKNRRMNPLNPRAARRAIRRIKAARKMLTSIERSLPTRTVRRRS